MYFIYRSSNGRFALYEDEGGNYNYESDVFSEIPISSGF
ncbi:MAG: DUF5110 domain-containing protein [Candidatus Promineifilaceae bacterium]